MTTITNGQNKQAAMDYLNVPGPVVFDHRSFGLNWSSHPADNFYKQEYLVKGENENKYQSMVLLDVITGESDLRKVVGEKIAGLKKMKEQNPLVNYEVFDNSKNGEYLLDFLVSANSPNGQTVAVVERNIYRYKTFTGQSGQKGILLFGISVREYGAGVTKFLAALKTNKKDLVNKMAAAQMPVISIGSK